MGLSGNRVLPISWWSILLDTIVGIWWLLDNREYDDCWIIGNMNHLYHIPCSLLDIPICTIDESKKHLNIFKYFNGTCKLVLLIDCSQISPYTAGVWIFYFANPISKYIQVKKRPLDLWSSFLDNFHGCLWTLWTCIWFTFGHVEVEMRTSFWQIVPGWSL
jgi:hypothetical protein